MAPLGVAGLLRHRLRASWQVGRPLLRSGDGTDLSRAVGPGLAGFLEHSAPSQAWESYALNSSQLETFEEQGYLSGIQILTEDECDALAAEVDSLLFAPKRHRAANLWYASHVPLVAAGSWRICFGLHDLPWVPRLRVAAFQLLGGPVRFLHDQIFCKPAQTGPKGSPSWFGYHQDFSYWSWTSPMAHLTCWIALDDSTAANGCVQYVPGSHRWGLLPPIPEGTPSNLEAVREVLTPEQRRALDMPVRVELKRGFASFHHPLALHGSDSNTTASPRRAVVVNTIRDGVLSNCGVQPASLGSFPFIPQGRPMGRSGHDNDRMYPLLLGNASDKLGDAHESAGPGVATLDKLQRLPSAL